MRFTRKLFLLCAMALAALAMSASAASAQTIEVSDEQSGAHCAPCVIHASNTSPIDLISHIAVPGMEVVASRCDNEFEAEIYEDGEGHIYDQLLTGAGCTTTPCPASEWEIHIEEDPATDAETLDVTFCVVRDGATILCDAEVDVDSSTHTILFSANQTPCTNTGGAIELTGTWQTELDTGNHTEPIEIVHP